jgi:hypothetical protein
VKKQYNTLFIVFYLIFTLNPFICQDIAAADKTGFSPSHHRIPFYAVDISNQLISDFKENEIELYLDKKPVRFSLVKYNKAIHKGIPGKQTGRVILIIIDSSLTGINEFSSAKKTAGKLVNNGLPVDSFSLLQLSPIKGLRLIIPRGTGKKPVIEQLKELEPYPGLEEEYRKNFYNRLKYLRSMRSGRHYAPADYRYKTLKQIKRLFQNEAYYENQTLRFGYFLSKLKNALISIDKPKIVFLLSRTVEKTGGGQDAAEHNYSTFFKNHLNLIIKEINESGSLLFLNSTGLNPVKNDASSYYELLIPKEFKIRENAQIEIKSTRKGIRLHYPKYMTAARPYGLMDNFQKRMFLLDVILGEPWAQLTGKVRLAGFNFIPGKEKKDEPDDEQQQLVQVILPGKMCFRKLDVFAVYINRNTRKVDIDFTESMVKRQLIVPFKNPADNDRFFVVIEPSEFSCIYNQVKTK